MSNYTIIHDGNFKKFMTSGKIRGSEKAKGFEPRDFKAHPVQDSPGITTALPIPLVPESEWEDRAKEMEETKSRLSDIRMTGDNGKMIDALDQNGQGYCWMYDPVMCMMIIRARDMMPYVRLSPHAPACIIKNFRDQGGWAPLAGEFLAKNGCPSEEFWPQKSMAKKYNTKETWENAKKYRITEGWIDMTVPAYDRALTFPQVVSCLLNRIPVAGDFMWWGHSVCLLDVVVVERGSVGIRILNSWTNDWEDRGMAVLQGDKMKPDGAFAPRVLMAA